MVAVACRPASSVAITWSVRTRPAFVVTLLEKVPLHPTDSSHVVCRVLAAPM